MRFTRASFVLLTIAVACQSKSDYNPDQHLTIPQQDEVMWRIIRYIAEPPDGLTREERFYKGYNPHYQEQMGIHRLDAYFVDDNGVSFFLVSRSAPSINEKRVATGGKYKLDEKGELIEYEEVFRTWKMVPDTLVHKSIFLFDKMVKGEPLEPYYTYNSGKTDLIEFPDRTTYYDKEMREWRAR